MRLIQTVLVASLFCLLLPALGCGDNHGTVDAEPFDTLQACYDEHTEGAESFGPVDAIKICCIDHPIGTAAANVVCGESSAACQTFVDANLDDASATAADITTACDGYIIDRAK